MDNKNLIFIVSFLAVLGLMFLLSILFRKRFWSLFGSLFPYLLAGILIFNLVSFQAINQPYFNPAYQGHLQRLPSSELIDLIKTSAMPLRAEWVYPLLEDYYQGRTLLIPRSVLDSLELSPELIISQGRLADVRTSGIDLELTEREAEMIMDLDPVIIPTREIDARNNITANVGDIYHLVREEKDPDAPLLLLRYENKLFFVPADLLPAGEEKQ